MTPAHDESSIDHAIALLLADETEAALRWGAGIVEREPGEPAALVVTSRLLQQMGRTRAAAEGLGLSFRQAIERGDLPLAMAVMDDLRGLGVDVTDLKRVAAATFCRGSARFEQAAPPPLPDDDGLQPLSPFLSGPALASRATGIVRASVRAAEGTHATSAPIAPLALFSALPVDALADLLDAFGAMTVPAGHVLLEEGERGAAVFILARGQVELQRHLPRDKRSVAVGRMGDGAFFGEMALLPEMPSAHTIVTTRPSIVLVAERAVLDAVASRHPCVATEFEAHVRRRLIANLGRGAALLLAVPLERRAELVDRFVVRAFHKGARLMREGGEISGLHLIASGDVAVVGHEGGETVVLAALGPGETVGDVELVLCRTASTHAVAVAPTTTLFLPRRELEALILEDPVMAQGLYLTAVRKAGETARAMEAPTAAAEAFVLDEEAEAPARQAPAVLPSLPIEVATSATQAPSEPPVAFTPRPPPSSLAPTTSVARPSMRTSPRAPAPSFATAAGLALAVGVVLTLLIAHADRRGAAGQVPMAAAPAVPEMELSPVSPVPTPTGETSSAVMLRPIPSSPPAHASGIAVPRASAPAHAAGRAARMNVPPAIPSVTASVPASTSTASAVAPRPAASQGSDEFGDRK